jgi:bacteriocin-like protein
MKAIRKELKKTTLTKKELSLVAGGGFTGGSDPGLLKPRKPK